jgi:Methionine biosynthesis protein MetW.
MADAARTHGGARVDLVVVAEDGGAWRQSPRRRLWRRRVAASARRDARRRWTRHRTVREGVNECVAKGLAVIQGDADTDLSDYPDDAFDYVILSQTLQATGTRGSCWNICCASAGTRSCRFPISALGYPPPASAGRTHAAHRQPAVRLVGLAQHPFLHHQGFPPALHVVGAKMEKAVAFNPWGRALRLNAPWWFWNLLGEQAVFLLSRRE